MGKWLIMEKNVLAIVEFLGLVGYEVLVAYAMKAFCSMQQKRKVIYLFWALFPLALMTMFHGESIGNDTRTYTDLFDLVRNMTLAQVLSDRGFEKGYMLFTYILTRISSTRQSVLIAEGMIVYLSFARWLSKWSKAPGMVVCLIVEMLVIDGWMNVLRQALAMAVLFLAFDALVEKRLLRFCILVVLAAQFHAVSYVFLFAYPMLWWIKEPREGQLKKNWIYEKIMVAGAIGIALLLQPVLKLLLELFPKYQYYISGVYMDGQARVAIILKIIILGLMLIVPLWVSGIGNRSNQNTCDLALYRMSIANIVLLVAANQATILTRISDVFLIYAIMYSSEHVSRLQYGKNRKLLTAAILILFALYGVIATIYRTPSWQTTYPFEWWT